MRRVAFLAPARWTVLVVALCAPAVAAPDWRAQRLEALLVALESLAQRVDGARASGGLPADRLADVERRVDAAEKRLGLTPGVRGGGAGIDGQISRADALGHRMKDVLLAQAAAATPPQAVAPQGFFVLKPPDPAQPAPTVPPPPVGPSAKKEIPWPTTLKFKASGKLHRESAGEWLLGPKHRSSWVPDFLQTGYAGTVAITVVAQGVLREAKSADLRLVLSVGVPFGPPETGLRVVDLTWKADRALNTGSKKTWKDADRLTLAGPYEWLAAPLEVVSAVEVEAHVRSLTLFDGTVFHFLAPEYVPKK